LGEKTKQKNSGFQELLCFMCNITATDHDTGD
jgi:hypothetical protein